MTGGVTPDALLDESTVVGYLAGRGLVDAATATAEALGGGVSNVTLAVTDGATRLVLKQSLPRLRVADEWWAPRERIAAEADALRLAARISPGSVPEVVDVDPAAFTMVLVSAPRGWTDWKAKLLAGDVDPGVAARLGELLARLHSATAGDPDVEARFGDVRAFVDLRVDAYHRTVAQRAPEHSAAVLDLVDEMLARRICLVHGDYSPKNVLVGPGGREWLIDFEVAHVGDPAFDLGFLLTHLLLKSLHLPSLATAYDQCLDAFMRHYETALEPALTTPWPYLSRHLGCLLLARVRGKSPAEYLTEDDRERAWRLGETMLHTPVQDAGEVTHRRDEVRR